MATLYRASTYGNTIEKIEATRVTEASYFDLDYRRKERRNSLEGNNFKVFTEHSAAVAWLLGMIENSIQAAQRTVEYRMDELNKFNAKYPQP